MHSFREASMDTPVTQKRISFTEEKHNEAIKQNHPQASYHQTSYSLFNPQKHQL